MTTLTVDASCNARCSIINCSTVPEAPNPALNATTGAGAIEASNTDGSKSENIREFPTARCVMPRAASICRSSWRGTEFRAKCRTNKLNATRMPAASPSVNRKLLPDNEGAFLEINVDELRGLPREQDHQDYQSAPPDPEKDRVSQKFRRISRRIVRRPTEVIEHLLQPDEGLHRYPMNILLRKNRAVGKSIQKKAHPRLTITNVKMPPITRPAVDGSRGPRISRHTRCPLRSIPCHNPQTTKLVPAPCHTPLTSIVTMRLE